MEAQSLQLGFGLSEGGKNSIPNRISDLERGPRNPSDRTIQMVGGNEECHSKASCPILALT